MWTVGQALGLSALALAWEFPELLPVAVAFFILGFFTGDSPTAPRWLTWTVGVLAFTAIAIVPPLRRNDWSLVTDDYLFLEVLSQHITRSGPFADWGVMNFSRYHWLPYGWNGLLSELGGRPEILTTLTRVMPFIYASSIAGSLLLLSATLRKVEVKSVLSVVPVWVIVSINRLEWSGTGTAGVFAVIAAAACTIILVLNSDQGLKQRLSVYFCFVGIAVLTKLPSVFALLAMLCLSETAILTRRLRRQRALAAGVIVSGIFVVASTLSIDTFAQFIGRVQYVEINPGLGQLADMGQTFAFFALGMYYSPLIIPAILLLATVAKPFTVSSESKGGVFLLSVIPLSALGLIFDIKVFGNANSHEYFSGPNYFASSLLLLYPLSTSRNTRNSATNVRVILVLGIALAIAGVLWKYLPVSEPTWSFLGSRLIGLTGTEIFIMQFFSSEMRTGAVVASMVLLPYLLIRQSDKMIRYALQALFLAIVLLTLLQYSESAKSEVRRIRSTEEVSSLMGPAEIQSVGKWIEKKTDKDDLVATDYRFLPGTGAAYSDYALAAWSNREYLLMDLSGPWFDENSLLQARVREEIISLGSNLNSNSRDNIKKYGVKWFVVDKWNSSIVDWRRDWDVEYENERFLVVKI